MIEKVTLLMIFFNDKYNYINKIGTKTPRYKYQVPKVITTQVPIARDKKIYNLDNREPIFATVGL
jgi:hypothetical protein